MKLYSLLLGIFFSVLLTGCFSSSNNVEKIEYQKLTNICKIDETPAPFWVCKDDLLNKYKDYYLINFKTYEFNSLEDEFKPKLRKQLKIDGIIKLLKKEKVKKELGITSKNYAKIYNLLIKNVDKIAIIDKSFVPFSQSNLRIDSYVLIVFNKKIIKKLLKNLKIKKNINNKYINYYK